MLITFEAASLNLDFLSVRMLCSTLARTDSQETLLILVLDQIKLIRLSHWDEISQFIHPSIGYLKLIVISRES